MKTFLVAWTTVEEKLDGIHMKTIHTDHFRVFCEGTKAQNQKDANEKYNELVEEENVYSANVCQLTKTSEHYE